MGGNPGVRPVPQVASDPNIHAANHHLPRVARPAQPDRAPSPFESLLEDTSPPAEPSQAPPESRASPAKDAQKPAKSNDSKAIAPTDNATASKPDDVAASDKKPAEDGETDDDSKVVASAKIDVAAGVGDSIKPDADHEPAAEQKTDTTNVAPTNVSAPTITTAEATAIVPAPAQAPSAAPDDGEQAGQESLQQVALVADTTPQIRQLDPALPKAVAGKRSSKTENKRTTATRLNPISRPIRPKMRFSF